MSYLWIRGRAQKLFWGLHIYSKNFFFSEYCSISALPCSFEFWLPVHVGKPSKKIPKYWILSKILKPSSHPSNWDVHSLDILRLLRLLPPPQNLYNIYKKIVLKTKEKNLQHSRYQEKDDPLIIRDEMPYNIVLSENFILMNKFVISSDPPPPFWTM